MAEIILDNYSACYEYGRLAALGELDAGRAALKAATETGMDYGSAQIYTRCVRAMFEGERFTGTVKESAMRYFLIEIFGEFGREGLRKALQSVKQYLEYQRKYNSMNCIQDLYDEFIEYI